TFKEIYRILKQGQGRMVISDLVTNKEVQKESIDSEKWCSCIDGALTRDNYIKSIKKAGFTNIEVLDDKFYIEKGDQVNGRKISSLVIKAVKE
ncbi:MAG TPA: protein-L-isoaspartate(D-aspartate) O-methyltransferase, partial [Nitrososphaeraceae archaeon]|nr:protein-L-isoaspartate(D-aspartate) O-methyltransferase [Nitrososphaeraceae archaeon]